MRFIRTRAGQSVLAAIGASFLLGGVANAAGPLKGFGETEFP